MERCNYQVHPTKKPVINDGLFVAGILTLEEHPNRQDTAQPEKPFLAAWSQTPG